MSKPASVDLLDVVAFVQVVETGSIANAANRLDVAKSIVSRRISRLETVLGAQSRDCFRRYPGVGAKLRKVIARRQFREYKGQH